MIGGGDTIYHAREHGSIPEKAGAGGIVGVAAAIRYAGDGMGMKNRCVQK
jgi:hypothetical protein